VNAQAPDIRTAFSLVDPATGKRHAIREMNDQQIVRVLAMIRAQSGQQMQSAIETLAKENRTDQDVAAAFVKYEQAHQAQGFAMVLEYEQNRRANASGLVLPPR
jgi:hypothetical protein